jgi:hypothetical protein
VHVRRASCDQEALKSRTRIAVLARHESFLFCGGF